MANCCGGNGIQNITQTLKLFEAAEENYRDDAAVESFVFRYTRAASAPQYSNSSKYDIYAHNNQKFGHSLRPPFFLSPRVGHGRRNFFDGFSS